jgi:eukaryotic-like serine/threonine-protein kinase
MPLLPGTRLGPYEIVAPLGAGGMGEVYRARDTRLGRDVAIKALPDGFANAADRLARFEREAQILASLNHTNIAAIHRLEEHDGARYLVLEYVPGETLAERIRRGPLTVEESLSRSRSRLPKGSKPRTRRLWYTAT